MLCTATCDSMSIMTCSRFSASCMRVMSEAWCWAEKLCRRKSQPSPHVLSEDIDRDRDRERHSQSQRHRHSLNYSHILSHTYKQAHTHSLLHSHSQSLYSHVRGASHGPAVVHQEVQTVPLQVQHLRHQSHRHLLRTCMWRHACTDTTYITETESDMHIHTCI
jgi:hypothetical protein